MNVKVTNLNNSIRFYNLLLDQRPDSIGYESASYAVPHFVLEEQFTPVTPVKFYLEVPDLLKTFKRMKSTFNRSASLCKVMEHSFLAPDPDGHQWIVYEAGHPIQVDPSIADICYLEPANVLL